MGSTYNRQRVCRLYRFCEVDLVLEGKSINTALLFERYWITANCHPLLTCTQICGKSSKYQLVNCDICLTQSSVQMPNSSRSWVNNKWCLPPLKAGIWNVVICSQGTNLGSGLIRWPNSLWCIIIKPMLPRGRIKTLQVLPAEVCCRGFVVNSGSKEARPQKSIMVLPKKQQPLTSAKDKETHPGQQSAGQIVGSLNSFQEGGSPFDNPAESTHSRSAFMPSNHSGHLL